MPLRSIWNDHKKWMVHLSQMGFEGFLPWDQACPCIRLGCHHGSVSTREHVFSFGHLLKVAWAKLLLSGPYLGRRPPRMRKGAVKFSKLVSLVRQGLLLVCWLVKGWCEVPTTIIWGEDNAFPQFPPINFRGSVLFGRMQITATKINNYMLQIALE